MDFIVNVRDTVSIAMIAGIAALFLPYLIDVFKQPWMSPPLRGILTQVVYGVVAVIIAFWQGSLDNTANWAAAAIPIFILAPLHYNFLTKPSGLSDAVYQATNIGGTPPKQDTLTVVATKDTSPIVAASPPTTMVTVTDTSPTATT
jgi:hypothetical protein